MSQTLIVQLSDRAFTESQRQAAPIGLSPEDFTQIFLENRLLEPTINSNLEQFQTEEAKEAARARFECHFGELSLGEIDVTNESIDADLLAEYANTHEDN